jgi:hypothetical protein
MPGTPGTAGNPPFARYRLTFSDPAGLKPNVTADTAASPGTASLDAGTWNVTVDGYIGTSPEYRAATGTAGPVTVSGGQNTDVPSITLGALPITAADPGTFAWNINISGITVGTITTAQINLQPLPSGTAASITLNPSNYAGSQSLAAGVYQLSLKLTRDDGKAAGINTAAHIYPGLTTTAAYTFTNTDFVSQVPLAGTVTIRKPSALSLTGNITVTAYKDAALTTQAGSPAIAALPSFTDMSGVETGTSGSWYMTLPLAALDPGQIAYFTVSVTDGTHTYTVKAGNSGAIPDNGLTISTPLALNIYGITVTTPTDGSITITIPTEITAGFACAAAYADMSAPAAVALTAAADSGYTLIGGRPVVTKTNADPVTVDGASSASGGAYTFNMPASDVTVSATVLSAATAITDFYFTIGGSYYGIKTSGAVSGSSAGSIGSTINITVPYGTSLTSLPAPTVTHGGASYTPPSQTNFSSPVSYTVTAADNTTTQNYTVTVTNEAAPSITEFYFTIGGSYYGINTSGAVSGSSAGSNGSTINITVPYGTPLTSLPAPTVTHGGASATRPNPQADFSSPVSYTVETALHSTSTYTVTVGNAALSSISVASGPTTTVYPTGATLNTTGLVIDGQDSLGTAISGLSGWTCSSLDSTSRGSKTITVTVSGKTTTFNVTVKNNINTLSSLAVSGYSLDPAFSAATENYTVTIPYGTAGPLTLTAALTDSYASFATGSSASQSIAINTTAAPGADCGSQTVTVEPDYDSGAAKTYTVTVKYGDGINVNGITNAGIPVITFSGSPAAIAPNGSVTISLSSGTSTGWHITVDGPVSYTHAAATFNAPAVNGSYTVNVIATINGIPYSGSFSLTVQ